MGRSQAAQKAARQATNVDDVIKKRKAAVEQMNPALRKVFEDIDQSLAVQKADAVRFYHNLGKKVMAVQDEPEKYAGADGTSGFKLLQQAMNLHKRTLQATAQFARTIDDDEMVALCGLYDEATNFSLHWGHMSFLMMVTSKAERLRFAKEAIRQLMQPAALYELIKQAQGGPKHGGKPHQIPDTVDKQVAQVAKLSRQWVTKDEEVWHGDKNNILTNIMNMPEADLSEALLLHLQEVGQCCETMAERTDELQRGYANAEQYVRQRLTEMAEADAEEALDNSQEQQTGQRRRRTVDVS